MPAERWTGARDDLDRRAAERIGAELSRRARASADPLVLAVVGGRSVGGIFAALQKVPVPWTRVHVVLADERLVPIDSDDSNWKLVNVDLVEPLRRSGALPAANIHPFQVDDSLPERGVAAYRETLRQLGGRFHVAVLSAGEDGHTASLFPRHPSVDDPGESYILVTGAPKPPPGRTSASRRLLAATDLGVIAFYGEGKREALRLLDDPELGIRDCPSKVVNQMSAGVVLTDLAPASSRN
jgi:6-phosphogluconolactonase